jgi:hypothetical protein
MGATPLDNFRFLGLMVLSVGHFVLDFVVSNCHFIKWNLIRAFW